MVLNQTIDAGAYSTSLIRVQIAEMASSTNAVTVGNSFSNAEVVAEYSFGAQSGSNQTVVFDTVETWSPAKNIRFKELARAEAIRDLSIGEILELDDLTKLRRDTKHPRTADEILWQRRQQKLTNKLLDALVDYVEFHKGTNYS